MSYSKGQRILMAEFDNVLRDLEEKTAKILDIGHRVGRFTGGSGSDNPLREELESEYLELERIWSSVADERDKYIDLVLEMGLGDQISKSLDTIQNFVVPISRRADHLFGLIHGVALVVAGWFEAQGDKEKILEIQKNYEEMSRGFEEDLGYIR